jgi:hypothetical protein
VSPESAKEEHRKRIYARVSAQIEDQRIFGHFFVFRISIQNYLQIKNTKMKFSAVILAAVFGTALAGKPQLSVSYVTNGSLELIAFCDSERASPCTRQCYLWFRPNR